MIVDITWGEDGSDPQLLVQRDGDMERVSVDARLSEDQVRAACAHLGTRGASVFAAWRAQVGLTASGSA